MGYLSPINSEFSRPIPSDAAAAPTPTASGAPGAPPSASTPQTTDRAVRAALDAQAKADADPGDASAAAKAANAWDQASLAIQGELVANAQKSGTAPDLKKLTQQILARYSSRDAHLSTAAGTAQKYASNELDVAAKMKVASASQAQFERYAKVPEELDRPNAGFFRLLHTSEQDAASAKAAVQKALNDVSGSADVVAQQDVLLRDQAPASLQHYVNDVGQAKIDALQTDLIAKGSDGAQAMQSQWPGLSASIKAELLDAALQATPADSNGQLLLNDAPGNIDAIMRQQANAIIARISPAAAHGASCEVKDNGATAVVMSALTMAQHQWSAMQISPGVYGSRTTGELDDPRLNTRDQLFTADDLYDTDPNDAGPNGVPFIPATPNAGDVKVASNGGIGDAHFAAALASLAHQNPQAIENAISYDSASGNFIVKLYQSNGSNGQSHSVNVTVTQSDLAQNFAHHGSGVFSSDPNGVPGARVDNPRIWPNVMEAAYAKLRAPRSGSDSASSAASDAAYRQISLEKSGKDALFALTGDAGRSLSTKLPDWPDDGIGTIDDELDDITKALANHQIVNLSTSDDLWRDGYNALAPNRVYEVVSASRDKSGSATAQVRSVTASNANLPTWVESSDPNARAEAARTDTVTISLSKALGNYDFSEILIGASQPK